MSAEPAVLIADIDSVLAELDGLRCRYDNAGFPSGSHGNWSPGDCAVAVNLCNAAILRIAPGSPHGARARSVMTTLADKERGTSTYREVAELEGALRALRMDVENGRMQSVVQLVHAELFSDFLDAAAHFLDEGYKDPAAVLVGSVLEEHLRKMCDHAGIDLLKEDGSPRRTDTLNADLAKANAYNKLDLKSVVAWLDLRNKAAHGHYAEYDESQVRTMLMGVRDFVTRHAV